MLIPPGSRRRAPLPIYQWKLCKGKARPRLEQQRQPPAKRLKPNIRSPETLIRQVYQQRAPESERAGKICIILQDRAKLRTTVRNCALPVEARGLWFRILRVKSLD